MIQAKKGAEGVAVRGLKNRRLVLSVAKSLEPIAVNVLISDVLQVAVMPVDKANNGESRYTVAAQIGPEKWVRLAVFDSAADAELLIENVAHAISGSRWPDFLLMAGISIVAGLVFVTMGAYFVNARVANANQAPASAGYGQGPSVQMEQDEVTMTVPPMSASPSFQAQPVQPAQSAPVAGPAAGAAGIQMSPENENAMQAYFGSKK
jgi:hypothetical protein